MQAAAGNPFEWRGDKSRCELGVTEFERAIEI
jgi:hypothetical protein